MPSDNRTFGIQATDHIIKSRLRLKKTWMEISKELGIPISELKLATRRSIIKHYKTYKKASDFHKTSPIRLRQLI